MFGIKKRKRIIDNSIEERRNARRRTISAARLAGYTEVQQRIDDEVAKIPQPNAEYRIIKRAHVPGSTTRHYDRDAHSQYQYTSTPDINGYVVQGWTIENVAYYNSHFGSYYDYGFDYLNDEVYENELKRIRESIDAAVAAIRVEVVWKDVAVNIDLPFPTFEAAQNWLELWLRPDLDAVYYDGNGKQLALPSS